MVWGVSAIRRKRLLHFRRLSEGTGRRGRELSCLQKVRRSRDVLYIYICHCLPLLSWTVHNPQWWSGSVNTGKSLASDFWDLLMALQVGQPDISLFYDFCQSIQCLSRAMLLLVEETLMSFLVGDTLFQQGWWLWMQGLEQAFENMVAFLSYQLLFINSHFLHVAADSGFPFYKGYVKGFLVVWILVDCCKKEKWGPGI